MVFLFFFFHLVFSSSLSDWDFSGLETSTYYNSTKSAWNYRYNFRKKIQTDSVCTEQNCIFFELNQVNTSCDCYASLDTEVVTIYPNDSQINFTYSYGVHHVNFTLICAESFSSDADYVGTVDGIARFAGPQGCKKSPKKKNGSKLGWGFAVFLIIIISTFLYFAVGIPVSYHVFHKRGIEVFPFILYITSFFGLVGYGAKFLFTTAVDLIRGTGKSRGGYTAL